VPWIAVLNPVVTTTAQEGLYVVYLYQRGLSKLCLSMNQGATQHLLNAKSDGPKRISASEVALAELLAESRLLRERLSPAALDDLATDIDLGANGFLPKGYENGNVAAIEYDVASLPDEEKLQDDLTRMLALYDSCVEIKKESRAVGSGLFRTPAVSSKVNAKPQLKPPIFRPKSSAAYIAEVPAQSQRREPLHEDLIDKFGKWVRSAGLVAATNVHPRDLTADYGRQHWLIEAKTVRPNAELAVRAAIGQLYSYRHFYYREYGYPDPALVALFAEPVGAALAALLVSLGIEGIWFAGRNWEGAAPHQDTSLLDNVKRCL
jgi:hypothetical protein